MAKPKGIQASELSGPEKAAAFMMSLEADVAAKVMAEMDSESMEILTAQIARMDEMPRNAIDGVVKEYETISNAMGAFL